MSATDYPPVRDLSFRQLAYSEAGVGPFLDIEDYESVTFCPEFIEKYGCPTEYWSCWNRLITTPVDLTLVPTYRSPRPAPGQPRIPLTFIELVENVRLVEIYKDIDRKVTQMNKPALGRREMEATVTQHYIKRFEEDTADSKVMESLIGKQRGWNLTIKDEADALRYMKDTLEKALKGRLDQQVEVYWANKGQKEPGLDVEVIPEWADENPEHMVVDPNYGYGWNMYSLGYDISSDEEGGEGEGEEDEDEEMGDEEMGEGDEAVPEVEEAMESLDLDE